jgi:hypothetical protein
MRLFGIRASQCFDIVCASPLAEKIAFFGQGCTAADFTIRQGYRYLEFRKIERIQPFVKGHLRRGIRKVERDSRSTHLIRRTEEACHLTIAPRDASSCQFVDLPRTLHQNHTAPGVRNNANDTTSVDSACIQRVERRVSIHQPDAKRVRPQKHRTVPVADQKRFPLWLVRVVQDANVHWF